MSRAINRFEALSRGNSVWLFWYVVSGALEALAQPEFEMTQQRLILLRTLDMQVRRVQELEGNLSAEKAPDWLLKEFLYLVSLAQPETKLDRKSTRLNSSHVRISYAVFCLKKIK